MKFLNYFLTLLMFIAMCSTYTQFYDPDNTIYTLNPNQQSLSHYQGKMNQELTLWFLNYWLYIAVWQKDIAKAKEFLEQGANPNTRIHSRDWPNWGNPLWVAVATEQPDMVRLLLDYGAIPRDARSFQALGKPYTTIKNYIQRMVYLRNISDEIFNRVIFQRGWPYKDIFKLAEVINNQEILQLLNDYASGIKQPTHNVVTPSMSITSSQSTPTSQPTMGQQPQPQPITGSQKTAFQTGISSSYQRFGNAKFWPMAYVGDLDGFQDAVQIGKQNNLLDNLYEVSAGRGKMPAVSAAILRRDPETSAQQYLRIINILLQAGANPNVVNADNQAPLIIATYTKAPIDFFSTLLAAGADPNITNEEGKLLTDVMKANNLDEPTIDLVEQYQKGTPPSSVSTVPAVVAMSDLGRVFDQFASDLDSLAQGINVVSGWQSYYMGSIKIPN